MEGWVGVGASGHSAGAASLSGLQQATVIYQWCVSACSPCGDGVECHAHPAHARRLLRSRAGQHLPWQRLCGNP